MEGEEEHEEVAEEDGEKMRMIVGKLSTLLRDPSYHIKYNNYIFYSSSVDMSHSYMYVCVCCIDLMRSSSFGLEASIIDWVLTVEPGFDSRQGQRFSFSTGILW